MLRKESLYACIDRIMRDTQNGKKYAYQQLFWELFPGTVMFPIDVDQIKINVPVAELSRVLDLVNEAIKESQITASNFPKHYLCAMKAALKPASLTAVATTLISLSASCGVSFLGILTKLAMGYEEVQKVKRSQNGSK